MLSDFGLDAAADGLATAATMMSLHDSDPGTDGSGELTGGAPQYARAGVAWVTTAAGVRDLSGPVTFDVPAGATVAFFGTWTDDGTWLGGDALRDGNGDPVIETFAGQGTYTVNTAELTVIAS